MARNQDLCCILNCRRVLETNDRYAFPQNPSVALQWAMNIHNAFPQLESLPQNPEICRLHFGINSYRRLPNGEVVLKANAVPTFFPNNTKLQDLVELRIDIEGDKLVSDGCDSISFSKPVKFECVPDLNGYENVVDSDGLRNECDGSVTMGDLLLPVEIIDRWNGLKSNGGFEEDVQFAVFLLDQEELRQTSLLAFDETSLLRSLETTPVRSNTASSRRKSPGSAKQGSKQKLKNDASTSQNVTQDYLLKVNKQLIGNSPSKRKTKSPVKNKGKFAEGGFGQTDSPGKVNEFQDGDFLLPGGAVLSKRPTRSPKKMVVSSQIDSNDSGRNIDKTVPKIRITKLGSKRLKVESKPYKPRKKRKRTGSAYVRVDPLRNIVAFTGSVKTEPNCGHEINSPTTAESGQAEILSAGEMKTIERVIMCPFCCTWLDPTAEHLRSHESAFMDEDTRCEFCSHNLVGSLPEEVFEHMKTHCCLVLKCLKCGRHYTKNYFGTHKCDVDHYSELRTDYWVTPFCKGGKIHYRCIECGCKIRMMKSLLRHVASRHKRKVNFEAYICAYCGEQLWRKGTLQAHIMTEHKVGGVCCKQCDKFIPADLLKAHRGMHELKQICPVCGDEVKSGRLKRHMGKHSDRKPHKCAYCDKTFRQKGNKDQHELLHTGELKYKCEFCNKRFNQSANYTQHLRVHTKVKARQLKELMGVNLL